MYKEENRTWCKYGNCSLEKLEYELNILDETWTNLEKNWAKPKDIEDVYRIYPLLDTTAAIARKMIIRPGGKKDKQYKVDIILPGNDKIVDTSMYRYPDEHKFFNGKAKKELLGDIVSKFLHGSEYVYMDTRKLNDNSDFKIYVFVKTDMLCKSCSEANLKNSQKDKINYKKTVSHIQYDDCTCGRYVDVRNYINSISKLLEDRISEFKTKNKI